MNEKINFSNTIRRNRKLLFTISIILSITSIIVESKTLHFIDSALGDKAQFVRQSFIMLIGLYIVMSLMVYMKKYLETNLEEKGKLEGQADIYSHLFAKSIPFFNVNESGVLLHNITSDIYEATPWYCYGRLLFFLECANLLMILIFMFYVEVSLTLMVIAFIMLSLILSNKMSLFLGKRINDKQIANTKLNQFMIETIKSLGTIAQLGKKNYFVEKFDTFIEKEYKPIIKRVVVGQALYISQLIFSQELIPFLILFLGMIFSILGKTTIGTTIVMMNLAVRVSKSVQSIGDLLPQKHSANEIMNRISTLFISTPDEGLKAPVAKFEALEIELNEYRYPNLDKQVMCDIKMVINKGDLVAIKGESGKGKSTILNLISGHLSFEDNQCKILYNCMPIGDLSKKEYYKHILHVGQEARVFRGTLKDNLLLGDTFSNDEVNEVIYATCLEQFMANNSLDFVIEENGKNISGGERQRIGLARILLRKPDLLLLDEVTSALNRDIRAELVDRILEYKVKYDMTIILVSHNDDFMMHCNKIYEL